MPRKGKLHCCYNGYRSPSDEQPDDVLALWRVDKVPLEPDLARQALGQCEARE